FETVHLVPTNHLLFFFSSRRRHTRWPRDWSSDVCSSDLGKGRKVCQLASTILRDGNRSSSLSYFEPCIRLNKLRTAQSAWFFSRSEERRVGKECRSRWSPYQ